MRRVINFIGMRNDNYFVALSNEALGERVDVHFDSPKARIEEV